MKFSVLIPVYRKEQAANFRQSLDSIFNQTLLPDEVVLVKDGPLTDMLNEVVDEYCRRYPMMKVVALVENQGLGQALNEGLKHCSYNLVARMDSDDVSKPERFKKQIATFCAQPDVDIVGSWIEEFIGSPDTEHTVSIRKLPEKHAEIYAYAKYRNPLNHVSVMFKKDKVEIVGSYQHFLWMEDYFLWIRMLQNKAKFYNIPESLVWVRNSDEMYNRRGGIKYACNEILFFKYLYHIHYISFLEYVKNVMIRLGIRVVPNRVRKFIYIHLLR